MTNTTPDTNIKYLSEEGLAILAKLYPEMPAAERELFARQCDRTQLDPLARQIYSVKRKVKNVDVWATQVSIDGFRVIAQRTGEYEGQSGPHWCGPDGKWTDVWIAPEPPAAARVGIFRRGFREPLMSIARYDGYVGTDYNGKVNTIWAKMPELMTAKCFSEDTEVLTSHGFRRFADVSVERIASVDRFGFISFVEAKPFSQPYFGDMIAYESDDIDFCVTPNHDMVTTFGRVEAGAVYETSHTRGPWAIKRALGKAQGHPSTMLYDLTGFILADGYLRNGNTWAIAVSRPDKIEALRKIGLHANELVQHCKGAVATSSSGRKITSNFDKAVFIYPADMLPWLSSRKQIKEDRLATGDTAKDQFNALRIVDAWQAFDGSTNKKTGVRRLYCSDLERMDTFEKFAVIAGYSVSTRKTRQSDIGGPGYYVTISDRLSTPIFRHEKPQRGKPGLVKVKNESGRVWCVTVPDGTIVVRRNGFSMLCGNCAEALGLRRAFPQELSGLYTSEEMGQADNPAAARVEATPAGPDLEKQLAASVAANAATKAALAPKPAPKADPVPSQELGGDDPIVAQGVADAALPSIPQDYDIAKMRAEIEDCDTPEKMTAVLPKVMGLTDVIVKTAVQAIFKKHRESKGWKTARNSQGVAGVVA